MSGRPVAFAVLVIGSLAAVLLPTVTYAQDPPSTYPPVTILLGNTQDRSFHSAIVDDDYRISVALPLSYETSTSRTYPVLYVLDPHLSFGTVTDVVRVGAVGSELPELIVVGIGYPGDITRARMLRERDYHSTPDAFLRFVREELIPLIDGAYRTDPTERGIIGHSLGGDFILYTLFHSPETFTRYLAGSPTFATAGIYEAAYARNHTTLPASLFLSAGERDDATSSAVGLNAFVETLQNRDYADLDLNTTILAGATHFSSRPLHHVIGIYTLYGLRR